MLRFDRLAQHGGQDFGRPLRAPIRQDPDVARVPASRALEGLELPVLAVEQAAQLALGEQPGDGVGGLEGASRDAAQIDHQRTAGVAFEQRLHFGRRAGAEAGNPQHADSLDLFQFRRQRLVLVQDERRLDVGSAPHQLQVEFGTDRAGEPAPQFPQRHRPGRAAGDAGDDVAPLEAGPVGRAALVDRDDVGRAALLEHQGAGVPAAHRARGAVGLDLARGHVDRERIEGVRHPVESARHESPAVGRLHVRAADVLQHLFPQGEVLVDRVPSGVFRVVAGAQPGAAGDAQRKERDQTGEGQPAGA